MFQIEIDFHTFMKKLQSNPLIQTLYGQQKEQRQVSSNWTNENLYIKEQNYCE